MQLLFVARSVEAAVFSFARTKKCCADRKAEVLSRAKLFVGWRGDQFLQERARPVTKGATQVR